MGSFHGYGTLGGPWESDANERAFGVDARVIDARVIADPRRRSAALIVTRDAVW